MKKKLLSLTLALLMALALLPTAALAADSDFTIVNGVLTMYNGPGGDVVIPYGVTSIGDSAFAGFLDSSNLTSVTIPSSVTSIGRRAFYLRSDLTSVTIPDSVTSIGDSAFYGCSSLTSVTIPNSVTSIGNDAFLGCDSLTSVTIPASVTSISARAFANCDNLTSILVEAGNPNYVSADGVLFNKDKTELLCYPVGKSGGTYTIPSSVTRLEDRAFLSSSLTSVTIPSGVTSIGDDVFRNCNNLTHLILPYGVTSIGEGAFAICKSMAYITIPSSVTSIGKDAFDYVNINVNIYYGGSADNWSNINADKSLHNVYVHCNAVSVDTVPANPTVGGFLDVVNSDYYASAVLWAVENGITNGTTDVTFSPERVCTVAEVLTLLWRANGSPQPKTDRGSEPDAYYNTAYWWALETHIVDSSFYYQPMEPCTRSMMADFLWRAMEEPATSASNPFTDVKEEDSFYHAVLWAVENGITNGTSATTFSPNGTCTRGQVVTFLYRALGGQ